MSDTPLNRLDLDAQITQIERGQAETRKFVAEQQKLMAEQQKLLAEQQKLYAEERKLDRDRWLAPWLPIAGLIGGILAIVQLALHLARIS